MDPLQTQIQNQTITSTDRATALSIQTMVLDSTGAGISVMLGMAAEHNLPLAFLAGGSLCVVSLLLLTARTTSVVPH